MWLVLSLPLTGKGKSSSSCDVLQMLQSQADEIAKLKQSGHRGAFVNELKRRLEADGAAVRNIKQRM